MLRSVSVSAVSSSESTPRDRGEATMWLAIATPIIMIACLVLVVVLWVQTNIFVAIIVFGLLCAAAWYVATAMRRRTRGF